MPVIKVGSPWTLYGSSASAPSTLQSRPPSPMSPGSPIPHPISPRSRRPLSPTSLRDVDLSSMSSPTAHGHPHPRRFPAPPTGHELMAMFPPPPPAGAPELRAGPTSGYFAKQERQFFAQSGKEIVRVRLDIDMPQQQQHHHPTQKQPRRPSTGTALPKPTATTPWPATGSPASAQPGQPAPLYIPRTRSSLPPSTPSQQSPRPTSASTDAADDGERKDDPDEAWRRPMPYNERRRAGKHTKRVVVRS
ncbi:hypothetical protein C8F01DRAFT_1211658 [Mycena amicta]|nr:hypothetical protein C8F01DRAFT_1211658 [Mycena amicta]